MKSFVNEFLHDRVPRSFCFISAVTGGGISLSLAAAVCAIEYLSVVALAISVVAAVAARIAYILLPNKPSA